MPSNRYIEVPLLPYEKQLIRALDITEEEYKEFVRRVHNQAYIRPACYELVPDVRNDATTIAIISLVVGVLSSAASYLLAPKPKIPDSRSSRSIQLGGVTGADRFAPTTGFDSLQEIAAYGQPVPIVFTRYKNFTTYTTGGLLISPLMVWSRLKSFGGHQVIELMAVAGQGELNLPDRAGVFLGNQSIDSVFEPFYQFYWDDGKNNENRLQGRNLRYGKLAAPKVPASSDDAFTAPSKNATEAQAFCGAFTPSNQTRFGVYAGIPNGTPYRPNWEIIQPFKSQDEPAQVQAFLNQSKFVEPYFATTHPFGGVREVSGADVVSAGMPGTGRNYGRHVGIISHNGVSLTECTESLVKVTGFGNYTFRKWTGTIKQERDADVDDVIEVYIGYGRQDIFGIPDTIYARETNDKDTKPNKPNLSDIQTTLDAEMERYVQDMSPGSVYMIGRTLWQVISRSSAIYEPGKTVTVKLKCIEVWSALNQTIGIVNKSIVKEEDWIPPVVAANGSADVDEAFYPLVKTEMAVVRNTRDCDITEIGIRSQIFVRFNGITNFNTLPVAGILADYNKRDIQVREGKNTSYAKRTAFFGLDVRPANPEGYRDTTRNEGFYNIATFAVTGSAPIDAFNYIRIQHPKTDQYEYRLRPFPSSVLVHQGGPDGTVFQLDASKTTLSKVGEKETYMGKFIVYAPGAEIKVGDYFTHPQMVGVPSKLKDYVYGQWSDSGQPTGVNLVSVKSTDDGETATARKISNIMSLAASEDPYFDNYTVGQRYTFNTWAYTRDPNKTITMSVTLEAYQKTYEGTPRNKWWKIVDTKVYDFTGTWYPGNLFIKTARDGFGEQYSFTYTITDVKRTWEPFDSPRAATRIFEAFTGVSEVSHYGDLVTRSCDNGPEFEVVYVNESVDEDPVPQFEQTAMVGFKLQSSNNFTSLDQLRVYMKNGIVVERLSESGTGSSNLITDLLWYLATNKDTGLGTILSPDMIDKEQLIATGKYLLANELFYDDVIADPINLRSWLAEKCPSLITYISIKNGRLAINPALPTSTTNIISGSVKVPISAMFTEGNILEDSFQLEWLELEERKMFQAAVIYNYSPVNKLPQRETVVVRYSETGASELPIEEFSLPHISSKKHAIKTAKYFLALRKHITHTITFKTLPYGLSLEPGAWIMVGVQMSPYNPANNGIVKSDGTVVSVSAMTDGSYNVWYWDRTKTEVTEGTLSISGGIATNLRDTVFSVKNATFTSQVYQVEALDVDTDGIVTVKASSFPVNSSGESLIAKDVVSTSAFTVVGDE